MGTARCGEPRLAVSYQGRSAEALQLQRKTLQLTSTGTKTSARRPDRRALQNDDGKGRLRVQAV